MFPNKCIHDQTILKSTVVSTPEKLESGLKDLRSSIISETDVGATAVVGLDVTMSNNDGICRMWLSTATRYIVIRLNNFGSKPVPLALSCFLEHPGITFVGVGIKFSLEMANKFLHGIKCRNGVDLDLLAACVQNDKCLEHCGLFDLAYRVCNIRVNASFLVEPDYNVIGAHLAFIVGNRLLGGTIPYSFKFYNEVRSSVDQSEHKCIT